MSPSPLRPEGPQGPRPARLDVQGEGLRLPSGPLGLPMAFDRLDASLVDRSPEDPFEALKWGEGQITVREGRLRLEGEALGRWLGGQLWNLPGETRLRQPKLAVRGDGVVRVDVKAKVFGLSWPVRVAYRPSLEGPTRIALRAESLKLWGWLPVGALRGLLGVDARKLAPFPKEHPLQAQADGSIQVDLGQLPYLTAPLRGLRTEAGAIVLDLGDRPARPRGEGPAWVEAQAQGEVGVGLGAVREAKLRWTGQGGQSVVLPHWGDTAQVQWRSGDVLIRPKDLVAAMAEADPAFAVASMAREGEAMAIQGQYDLGLKWPVRFRLSLSRSDDGGLLLTPSEVRTVGFKAGESLLREAMAKHPALTPEGAGYRVDLKRLAGLELRLAEVKGQGEAIALKPEAQP